MVFIDTDVLSIFAKVQRLPLLYSVFNEEILNISSAVEIELQTGVVKRFDFVQNIMMLRAQGQIVTHQPTDGNQPNLNAWRRN